MARLALTTIGVLHEAFEHPRIKGFIDRIPDVYARAEGSEGFLGRSVRDPETGEDDWGGFVCPQFFADEPPDHVVATFSLWCDLESVMTIGTYNGGLFKSHAKGTDPAVIVALRYSARRAASKEARPWRGQPINMTSTAPDTR